MPCHHWGYGALSVVNLFAWRATSLGRLRFAEDPVGPDNEAYIVGEATTSALLIAAWGAPSRSWIGDRGRAVCDLLQCRPHELDLYHVGLTKGGHPRHPLYVRGDVTPQRWR